MSYDHELEQRTQSVIDECGDERKALRFVIDCNRLAEEAITHRDLEIERLCTIIADLMKGGMYRRGPLERKTLPMKLDTAPPLDVAKEQAAL